MGRNIPVDYGSGSDDRTLANGNTWKQNHSHTDECIVSDHHRRTPHQLFVRTKASPKFGNTVKAKVVSQNADEMADHGAIANCN